MFVVGHSGSTSVDKEQWQGRSWPAQELHSGRGQVMGLAIISLYLHSPLLIFPSWVAGFCKENNSKVWWGFDNTIMSPPNFLCSSPPHTYTHWVPQLFMMPLNLGHGLLAFTHHHRHIQRSIIPKACQTTYLTLTEQIISGS